MRNTDLDRFWTGRQRGERSLLENT